MTYRIPPSLYWLTKKRARLKADLDFTEKAAKDLLVKQEAARKQIAAQKVVLERDLQAIDRTICMHEIPIDPSKIRSVRPHRTKRIAGHGAMTRAIFRYLWNLGGASACTKDIAVFVAVSIKMDPDDERFPLLRYRVRQRLKDLVAEHRIIRVQSAANRGEGRWAIAGEAQTTGM